MPQTAFWGYPYPDLNSAPDGPAQLRALGESVEAATAAPPLCIVRNNTTLGQTVTDGNTSILTLDTPVENPADMYSTPNTVVIKLAGVYDIDADCAFPYDPDGSRFLALAVNNAEVKRDERPANTASGRGTSCSVHWTGRLAPNDRIQLQGWQNSGGNLTLLATATTVVRLAVRFRHA